MLKELEVYVNKTKTWKSDTIRDSCKHWIKCTEKWYVWVYKCKNHIIMEFVMQNSIQSKQMMCHHLGANLAYEAKG